MVKFGLLVFYLFDRSFIWFSICLVLWIWSNVPARSRAWWISAQITIYSFLWFSFSLSVSVSLTKWKRNNWHLQLWKDLQIHEMGKTESLTDLAPGIALGLLLALSFYIFFEKRRKTIDTVDKIASTLDVIKSRRTISPKNLNGKSLSNDELDLILEAANWAPTHKKTEPW